MSLEFPNILQGLMENRRLSPRAVSDASKLARSTINQLLNGRIPPKVEILQDIAPVLEIPLADLLVIAGLPTDSIPDRPGPYQATLEIGQLVSAASFLPPEQVSQLVDLARELQARHMEEYS